MKMRMRHFISCGTILAALIFLAAPDRAGAPMPSLTFYGLLVDEFGWPYETNVRVDIFSAGDQIFSKSIAPARGRDYNFLVRIPYDSGTTATSYTSDAIVPGELVNVKIVALDSGAVLVNTNLVVNFPAGAVFNINLTAGTDSVGDGLPDELRRWIWLNTGVLGPFDPKNIRAQDDSDFDGVSNLDEFRAGTDPANKDDVLQLEVTDSGVPNVGKLTFYSVPGKTYQIRAGDLSADNIWSAATFANSPTGPATFTEFVGTGHFVDLFVPTHGLNSFYRIFVAGRKPSGLVP